MVSKLSASWKRGFAIAKVASIHSNGDRPGERMGAALFSGPILVSTGHNLYDKTHPKAATKKHLLNVHCEHLAIIRQQYRENTNLTMYVYRQVADNKGVLSPAISKPCNNCQLIMKLANVKRVRYYNLVGEPEEMRLK